MKLFKCKVCGQLVYKLEDTNVPMICCGEAMEQIFPCSIDFIGNEKHVPVVDVNNNEVTIQVGSTSHPMINEHYIKWVRLETNKGSYHRDLYPGDSPVVRFNLCKDEKVLAVYAYCNIHGLWKK